LHSGGQFSCQLRAFVVTFLNLLWENELLGEAPAAQSSAPGFQLHDCNYKSEIWNLQILSASGRAISLKDCPFPALYTILQSKP
jgi:hypothetical protein